MPLGHASSGDCFPCARSDNADANQPSAGRRAADAIDHALFIAAAAVEEGAPVAAGELDDTAFYIAHLPFLLHADGGRGAR